ncbi:MAG TPA: flagellar hook-associated protein FlgK [Rhodothermales bacterium]
MPISRLHYIGRSALMAATAAMNTTGENISNVNSEGYSRRRITLSSDLAASSGYTMGRSLGSGVVVSSYERMRDTLLDRSTVEAHSSFAYSQEQYRVLSTVESLFPSGTGSLENVVSNFWNAWSDLANNPVDNGVREAVRAAGETLAGTLNHISSELTRYAGNIETDLNTHVDRANELLAEIGRLNVAIRHAEASGSSDLNAMDERDRVIKELADLVPLQLADTQNGGIRVSVRGHTLVEDGNVTPLVLDTAGAAPVLKLSGTSAQINVSGDGKIGALIDVSTTTIPELQTGLDKIAEGFVKEVNALHANRYDANGVAVLPPAPNFFYYVAGPSEEGISAADIRVSDEVRADATIVGTPGYYTANGQEIAFAIEGLRGAAFAATDNDIAENFIINLKSRLGASIQGANARAGSRAATLDHLNAMTEGVSGVSLDEELAKMIQFQQSYAASARVLNSAEEMLDILMTL